MVLSRLDLLGGEVPVRQRQDNLVPRVRISATSFAHDRPPQWRCRSIASSAPTAGNKYRASAASSFHRFDKGPANAHFPVRQPCVVDDAFVVIEPRSPKPDAISLQPDYTDAKLVHCLVQLALAIIVSTACRSNSWRQRSLLPFCSMLIGAVPTAGCLSGLGTHPVVI